VIVFQNLQQSEVAKYASADGTFNRPESQFRNTIPSEKYPAEAGRYVLYINYGCPWAHRTNIVRTFKGLEDMIELIEVDAMAPPPGKGWFFSGTTGPDKDPYTGAKFMIEMYLRDDPGFTKRPTVPMLWDKKSGKYTSF
jgi:putative glutathione S-transferase